MSGRTGQTGRDWRLDAACVNRPELPWIEEPAEVGLGEEATMGVVCDGCPVREACAAYARSIRAAAGFWAGGWATPATRRGESGRVA